MLLAWLLAASSVAAHALLVESTPADGAVLDVAPPVAVLRFSETIDPNSVVLQLFDEGGTEIALAQPVMRDDWTCEVALPQILRPGSYTLLYQLTSLVDGHTSIGSISFSVGTGQQPTINEITPPPAVPDVAPMGVVGRSIELLGGLAAFGGLIWLMVLVLPLLQRNPAVGVRVLKWTVWGIQWGLLGVMAGAALVLLQRLLDQGGINSDTFAQALQRRWGVLALVRILGASTLMPLIFLARQSRFAAIFAAVLLSGIMLTWSLTGHAATVAEPLFPVFADWMHALMAAVWLGGVVGLATVVVGLRTQPDLRRAALRYLVPRFSPIALGTIALVLVTGTFRAFEHLTTWSDLWLTDYGRVLLIKLALLSGALVLGLVHWRKTGPRLETLSTTADDPLYRSFGRSVGWESIFAMAVVLVTGMLVQTPHPVASIAAPTLAPQPTPTPQPTTLNTTTDDIKIQLELDDTRPGLRTFTATISDSAGIVQADRVRLSFESQALETGRGLLILEPQADGSFQGSSRDISLVGPWKIELQVRRVNLPDTTVSWVVEISR